MRYAVIMAGGSGKRLWPLSRRSRPKQLLHIVEGRSLLEMAVNRLDGLFEPANILVITNASYADAVAEALPQLPRENIVGEPIGRDTANAIALGAELLAARDGEATMAVFTADHVIRPEDCFRRTVEAACDAAEANPNALLTFGVKPNYPHTGLGYIHCGGKLSEDLHRVMGFVEKPDHTDARRYVESGNYFWNSGMFVWKVSAIRSCLEEYLPESVRKLAPVRRAAAAGEDYSAPLAEAYPKLERISIDYAVMEKAREVLMVDLRCEWLDIGSWPALENVAQKDGADNVVVADRHVVLDSFRNVIVSEDEHLIALLGVDDCIIVHSKDATLVCDRADSQRIKDLVTALEKEFGEKYV